jgi:flavodoxin
MNMKGLIIYRSHFGNTRLVAETLARQIEEMGHTTILQDLKHNRLEFQGLDFIMIGSPTRFARPDGKAIRALMELRKSNLIDLPLAIFDTFGPLPSGTQGVETKNRWLYPGAAGILLKTARAQGLKVYADSLRCTVQGGQKGPLGEHQLEHARAFAETFITHISTGTNKPDVIPADLAALY